MGLGGRTKNGGKERRIVALRGGEDVPALQGNLTINWHPFFPLKAPDEDEEERKRGLGGGREEEDSRDIEGG
jgi:hypothetical protein